MLKKAFLFILAPGVTIARLPRLSSILCYTLLENEKSANSLVPRIVFDLSLIIWIVHHSFVKLNCDNVRKQDT